MRKSKINEIEQFQKIAKYCRYNGLEARDAINVDGTQMFVRMPADMEDHQFAG